MRISFRSTLLGIWLSGAFVWLGGFSAVAQSGTNCIPVPTDAVSWWRAESDAVDAVGTHDGTLTGNTTYGAGRTGLGFTFDGAGDSVLIGNPVGLRLQDFTIEMWIKRASSTAVTLHSDSSAAGLVAYGVGGYGFGLQLDGKLFLTHVGVSVVTGATAITNTAWHHVAVTKSGGTVTFYLDGTAYSAPAYNPGFNFSSSLTLGATSDVGYGFLGAIDETAIYNRPLSGLEIQALYNAGAFGKCTDPVPPVVIAHPINQTVFAGQSVAFSTLAVGDPPLTYQWTINGTNISGATNTTLTLTNVQAEAAAGYAAIVANPYGSVTSSVALLTVSLSPTNCIPLPTNAVGWWQAEGNALDDVGTNHGTLTGNTTYGAGRTGLGFTFDGAGDSVSIGNPVGLRLQDFTIEMWIKRASPTAVTLHGDSSAAGLVAYGVGGYGFGLQLDGKLFLTHVGVSVVTGATALTNTAWHHVAVTKSGSTVTFYLDGTAYSAPAYNPGFSFSSSLTLGATSDLGYGFLGAIDEAAIYGRPLAGFEIQALYLAGAYGKCTDPAPPAVFVHPANRTVVTGASTTFNVTATGTQPLNYQWYFNETNAITGATNDSFTLNNVQLANAGKYSVGVTNAYGSATSSNAVLTVTIPPAVVRLVGNNNAVAGSTTVIPVQLVANGNENALSLSVSFNTNLLAFKSVIQGSSATNASLFYNTTQTNNGRIGLLLGLGAGETFSSGLQELALVSFDVIAAPASSNRTTSLTLVDAPTIRQLSDVAAVSLPAFYSNTSLTIPAVVWEADTAPRPNGDKVVSVTDWVQVGRFVAHLDTINDGSEYQRADCAPRSTLGNGVLSITDWVQAGRYAAGLDALTVVGGPSSETPLLPPPPVGEANGPSGLMERTLRVVDKTVQAAETNWIAVQLTSQGDENALGFSLHFSPGVLQCVGVSLGSGASGAAFNPNISDVGAGNLGIALALPAGTSFTAGTVEVAKVGFAVAPTAASTTGVGFANSPVRMEVSDAGANTLTTSYVPGTLTINPFPPLLRIGISGTNVLVRWPVVASNYVLQVNEALSGSWSNAATPTVIGPDNVVSTPLSPGPRFYRLFRP